MDGIQRFFLCVLSLIAVLICFPNYGDSVWSFAGLAMVICFGGLIILSLIVGLFGLDRFNAFNKFLTLVVWVAFTCYLLWNLPQEDKVSPINKLKHGQIPTGADLSAGAKKLTFKFNFVPNLENPKNPMYKHTPEYIEQELMGPQKPDPVKKATPKKKEKEEKNEGKVEIFMEDEEGYVDAGFMPED